jgi:hypothetical protein
MNDVENVNLKVLDDAQLDAEREERKQAKIEAQQLRKQKRAEQEAQAKIMAARQNLAPKMTAVTFQEAKVQIREQEQVQIENIVLPEEAAELERDPAFQAKLAAVDLREQAFQALDFRKGMREKLDELQSAIDKERNFCSRLEATWMKKWEEKFPHMKAFINSKEPSCVAHRAKVMQWNEMAIAKVDQTYARVLKARAELAEVNAWLQQHGNDHIVLFQKAEKICRDAGVDYSKIWPMKEKANVGA